MREFEGRRAVVSGATKGIGKAIATAFLESGATVIGVYGSDRGAAERAGGAGRRHQCEDLCTTPLWHLA